MSSRSHVPGLQERRNSFFIHNGASFIGTSATHIAALVRDVRNYVTGRRRNSSLPRCAGSLPGRPDPEHLDLVMREAFRDNNVAEDLAAVGMGLAGSHNLGGSRLDSARELADRAAEIRRYDAPRPYWPQRHGRDTGGPVRDRSTVRRGFDDLIAELERDGYLAQVFPRPCVDGDEPQPDISLELERRLGIAGLWPLRPESWDDHVFYGVSEVYHDLVSRPRARWYHDYGGCGWHYRDFATITGREVYR
jgi:hypothetical protein